MNDKIGLYYFPYPNNKNVKMYVRMKNRDIEFRMRNNNDSKMWVEHGWIPREAIAQAKILYTSQNGFNPSQVYDVKLAEALLEEN